MAKSIQFKSADDLLEGYKNTQAKGWSLWDGKQFLTKGIGYDLLDKFLDAFQENSSRTIYTLKIYDEIDDSKLIKERTEADGSFNFVFSGDETEYLPSQYVTTNSRNKLLERVATMEAAIKGINDTVEPDNTPQTIGAAFMDMLVNPSKLSEFIGAIHQAKNLFTGSQNSNYIPVAIPQQATMGTTEPPVNDSQRNDPKSIERAQKAIDTLMENDDNLIFHLEKLAKISASNPGQFKFLINLLDNM